MSRAAALLCAAVIAGACAPDDDTPPIVWSGQHLDFAPRPGADELCAGTLPYMDRYLELVGSMLDVEVLRSTYVLGSEDEGNPCDAVACQFGDTIYTSRAPHEHELVHAALESVPSPYRFYEEGAAVALGGEDDVWDPNPATWGPLREGIESCAGGEILSDAWYPRAGHLFAYLHRYHGAEATSALLRSVPRRASADEAIAALEAATAMGLDDMTDDLEATDPFCEQARWFRHPVFPCDAPEALRPRCDGGTPFPVSLSLGCADETALGPRDGLVFGYVAIEIPTDGYYRIQGPPRDGGGQRGRIEIKECAFGCSSRHRAFAYHGVDIEVWLRAGRYSLRFARDVEAEDLGTMGVTIAGDCG